MPYDACIKLRQGSVRPLYAEVDAPDGGTAVVQSGALFSLYREDGGIVAGFSGVPVSGFEPGPQQRLRVWYLLNTAALAAGGYSGVFSFTADGSDGIDRTFAVDLQITITPPVEVIGTYDETLLAVTPLFQVRLHAADTDVSRAIWSDAELLYLLTASGGVVQLAAAQALEMLALDRARLANAVRIGAFSNGEAEAYKAITERAKRLRAIAPVPPCVRSPDRVFVPSYDHGRRPGNMKDW